MRVRLGVCELRIRDTRCLRQASRKSGSRAQQQHQWRHDEGEAVKPVDIERKTQLETIIKPGKNIRYSDHIVEHGRELYKEVAKVPLEGVVAKRLISTYVQKRSRDWLTRHLPTEPA